MEPWTRLTPSANGWVRPSGPCGKCHTPNGGLFEGVNGFGFEEWLFNPDHREGEWQFGYIQAFKGRKHAGRCFNKLQLVTRICKTQNRLTSCNSRDSIILADGWYEVAVIEMVKCLTDQEANRVLRYANQQNWVDRMRTDLTPDQRSRFDAHHLNHARELFNVVFRRGRAPMERYAGLIPMEASFHHKREGKRFALYPSTFPDERNCSFGPDWLFSVSRI
jgi:hypothetical protein